MISRCPILASWRGVENEVIPAQVPFNAAIPGILDATGIPLHGGPGQ